MRAKLSNFNHAKSMHKPGQLPSQLSSKLYTHITVQTDCNLSSRGYLAREVLTAGAYSQKSDVYAFGVVSYIMVVIHWH